jgi:ribosomal protein S18 acetylase RimI-like enzyme
VPDRHAIELVRFYVDAALQGRGLAHTLMQAALSAAAQRARTMWLGVWERNARAIAFYAKWGFIDIGDHVFMLGSDRQTDRIMWRAELGGGPLTPNASLILLVSGIACGRRLTTRTPGVRTSAKGLR